MTVYRVLLLSLVASSAILGCAPAKTPKLDTYPVSGQVMVNGKPAVRAEVRMRPTKPLLDPLKRSVEPYGIVEADGMFRISTYREKDGAPPGEYAITVVWPTVTVDGGEEVFGPDQLHGRFSNPVSPVTMFTVLEASNLIPSIELKLP